MFSKETYIQRRDALKKTVGKGVLLFFGNDEAGANYADNCYPFRQDSTFLYFFGLPYAGLAAMIDIDSDCEIIFGNELTVDDIVWMGAQPSLREKCNLAGVSHVRPAEDLAAYLERAVFSGRQVHYLPPYRAEHVLKLQALLGVKPGGEKPSLDFIRTVVGLRNYKSEEEIAEIERACRVTAEMHLTAMRAVRPGRYEYEVVAEIEAVARRHNCRLSFPTIATVNGQTLHNHCHGNRIESGRLFLVDAGAETEMGYAGDMSTTVPADDTFTPRQREVYELQVACQEISVAALCPGIRFEEVYDLSARVIVVGLTALGLMRGDVTEAVALGAHALFYPHGLGHMMGLDVHDMENLGEIYVGHDGKPKSGQFGRRSLRLARKLEPGFVHTIEPGIYFIPELIDRWKSEKRFTSFINYDKVEAYRNIGGIRNEEDYLITPDGARLLGTKIGRHAADVEAIRRMQV
ncbi:MAG: aminopeptidase P family protein [Tannerella sp.]|jgi:Xaa-Pro aminopeptidase|nr:aminopeptidase P family protein [Tannerella sp.]